MARYRAEHNQELQGYFVEIPDNPFDPQYYQISFAIPNAGNALLLLTQPQSPSTGELIGGARVARAMAPGGAYLSNRLRNGYETAAAANSGTGAAYFSSTGTGHLSGQAGYNLLIGGGFSIVNASYRWFMGLGSNAAAGVPDPSSLTNVILIGADSADSNVQLMHNDAAGTCTKIDLGPNFPARTLAATYNFFIKKLPNSSTWDYIIRRLDTGIAVDGSLSGSNFPSNTTAQFPVIAASNGAVGGVVSIDVFGFISGIPYSLT